jgi:thiol:disulfide interchange protein
MISRRAASLLMVAALAAPAVLSAQMRPKATVTPCVEQEPAAPGQVTRLAITVALPEGLHVQSDAPRDPSLIPTVLTIDPPAGITVKALAFPTPSDLKQEGQEQPLAVFEHEFVAGAHIEIAASVAAGEVTIPGRLRYQACDDHLCYPPTTAQIAWTLRVGSPAALVAANAQVFSRLSGGRVLPNADAAANAGKTTPVSGTSTGPAVGDLAMLDRFSVSGTTGGYLGKDDFLQFVRDAENGVKSAGLFEGRGPLAILIIIILGGLALNLTPCVLPMIPINLAIIGAGAQAGSRSRGFLLGSAYGGAMALVYGVLGLVVILTAGTFGTLNASPWFNVGIAVVFVILALGMFDVIPIDFSQWSATANPSAQRGSFALAFTMGAVAALLAGACVAPVVIQVILFSSSLYTGGTTLALSLPFFLGLGMALPWPLAGAGIAALPKPGPWMVRVKQAMGVLILGTAVYYGYLGYEIFDNRRVEAGAVSGSVQQKLAEGWSGTLADGLTRAEREQKPVLIDFWATWCKNCLTMDKTTFENAEVKTAIDGYVKIKVQAEDPDAEPAKSLLSRFDSVGLPTYVILKPGNPQSAARNR